MPPNTLTPEAFMKAAEISPAVLEHFIHYEKLLLEWNSKINLVSGSTLPQIWLRHFMDSAQLYPLIKQIRLENPAIADLGSGAGFPGMVLAMMGAGQVCLIERDTRKAAFLRSLSAQTGIKVEILNLPIEAIKERSFDIITSRALAEVGELLEITAPLRKPSTVCLFLKGKNLDAELAKAEKQWVMEKHPMPSVSDATGIVLRLKHIVKV